LLVAVDKLGGRNFYAPILQSAFPDGWVHTLCEGSAMCHYQILGLEREIQIVFQPRADSAHMTVAIASMISKYVREVCMMQFNRWWAQHVPGIKPTAGYPLDATRFMDAIRPKLLEMAIEEARIWRRK
jgi:ribonuclease HII